MEKLKTRRVKALLCILLLVFFLSGVALCWHFYDNNVDRSGWENRDGTYYYRDFHSDRVTGWQDIDGKRYYFGEDKTMQTGWQTIDGLRYCFHPQGGFMLTGWQNINEDLRYFHPNGVLAAGWTDLPEGRYYMDAEGRLTTGWMTLDGRTYHFTEEGLMETGPKTIDGKSYYFLEDGPLFVGLVELDDGTHYFTQDGTMATGWQTIDDRRYYFDQNGIMATGWLTLGEYSYYLQEDGSAATGPLVIDGRQHYFTPKGIHVILVNADNPIPDYWNPEILTLEGWTRVAEIAYEPMQRMVADCLAAGHKYVFNSAYRSHRSQIAIVEQRTREYMRQGMDQETALAKTLETAAYPGTSEHEMGLAADITGEDAKIWLGEHCWEYGFILRYPPEKQHITGIINEPWHFRYVGTAVSLDMKDSGLCLEEYLGAPPVGSK